MQCRLSRSNKCFFLKLRKSGNCRQNKDNDCFKVFNTKIQYKSGFSYLLKKHRFICFQAFALGQQVKAGNPGEYERPRVRDLVGDIGEVFAYALKGCGFEFLFYI